MARATLESFLKGNDRYAKNVALLYKRKGDFVQRIQIWADFSIKVLFKRRNQIFALNCTIAPFWGLLWSNNLTPPKFGVPWGWDSNWWVLHHLIVFDAVLLVNPQHGGYLSRLRQVHYDFTHETPLNRWHGSWHVLNAPNPTAQAVYGLSYRSARWNQKNQDRRTVELCDRRLAAAGWHGHKSQKFEALQSNFMCWFSWPLGSNG